MTSTRAAQTGGRLDCACTERRRWSPSWIQTIRIYGSLISATAKLVSQSSRFSAICRLQLLRYYAACRVGVYMERVTDPYRF